MKILVTGQRLSIEKDLTVENSVNIYECEFGFDSAWDGFDKTAVFQLNGEEPIEVVLVDDACVVPHEVLAKNGHLRIGVYGTKDEKVMPTIWGERVLVNLGTPTGSPGTTPTPSVYAQILEVANDAKETAEAVETAWGNVSAAAETLQPNESATVVFEDDTFKFGIPKGSKGDTGESGFSPTITVIDISGGHRVTITDSQGMESFDVLDGHDGQNGADGYSPTIAVSNISGGHRLTITDTNGTRTVDVMDGEQGQTGATGNGIASITKTGTVGLVDTYTIAFTDGNSTTFTVTNGADGTSDFAEYLPIDSASGSIASFSDGAKNIPVESLKVNIVATQSGSGDPSPNNIRPISGHTQADVVRCGVNVWDEVWEVGGFYTATGLPWAATDRIRNKNFIPIVPNAMYYIKIPNGANSNVFFYDANKEFISVRAGTNNVDFTAPSNAFYMNFNTGAVYGTTYKNDISINYPSTDTTYHSYNGTTHTIPFGTTVYGGSLEVETGVLTVTYAKVTLDGNIQADDITQVGWQAKTNSTGIIFKRSMFPSKAVTGGELSTVKCDKLPTQTYGTLFGQDVLGVAPYTSISANYGMFVRIPDTSVTDKTKAIAYFNNEPMDIVFELAEPQTIQLTPVEVSTILGQNNIYANTGTVEVVYRADIQGYIDKKISALASLI